MSDNDEGAAGFLDQSSTSSEYNSLFFKVMGILAQNNFNVAVQVVAVKSAGELAMTGVIDVVPMVNQVTGDGVSVPHSTVHGIPYFRMQGGGNAIIMDPQVGDIGFMMCADKDISSVKSNQAISNAGSARVHDYADGVYFGGLLNGVPTQYVQFNTAGIAMHSPTKITLSAPVIEFDATTSVTSNAPSIAMNASTKVATTSPQVAVTASSSITESTAAYSLTATTGAGITSPLTTVTGAEVITGLASLNGGFGALAPAGGGANTITGNVSISGATTLNTVTAGGKNIGGMHAHSGVQTGSGTSGGPI